MSPGGENLLDFLEVRQVLSKYDGDLRDPLWCPQERPVPKRVARGPLGIPLPSKLGPKTLCGASAGTCGFLSSADMNLGVLLDLPRGVSPPLEWGNTRVLSSRAVAAVSVSLRVDQGICGFPSRLPHEAFHRALPRATMV